MKRISAGYYEERMDTVVNGNPTSATVVVSYAGKYAWMWEADIDDNFLPAEDYYPTKKSAMEAAKSCMECGWEFFGLGLCLKSKYKE